jgi:hypothetical protein
MQAKKTGARSFLDFAQLFPSAARRRHLRKKAVKFDD